MTHDSQGKGPNRHIVVSNEKPKDNQTTQSEGFTEYLFFTGYIGLKGSTVEYSANRWKHKVDEDYIKKREQRDGEHHHITLVNKKELESIVEKLKIEDSVKYSSINFKHIASTLMKDISNQVKNDWIEKGLGKLVDQDNEAFFVVVSWESLNNWRKARGLAPRDFHITLGFKTADIHDKPKDESSLIDK